MTFTTGSLALRTTWATSLWTELVPLNSVLLRRVPACRRRAGKEGEAHMKYWGPVVCPRMSLPHPGGFWNCRKTLMFGQNSFSFRRYEDLSRRRFLSSTLHGAMDGRSLALGNSPRQSQAGPTRLLTQRLLEPENCGERSSFCSVDLFLLYFLPLVDFESVAWKTRDKWPRNIYTFKRPHQETMEPSH